MRFLRRQQAVACLAYAAIALVILLPFVGGGGQAPDPDRSLRKEGTNLPHRTASPESTAAPSQTPLESVSSEQNDRSPEDGPGVSDASAGNQTRQTPTPTSEPAPGSSAPTSAPPPASPGPEPTCDDRASQVSERIYRWYQAAGQSEWTYQVLAFEGFNVYLALCTGSVSGQVELENFCHDGASESSFFLDQAGTQRWLNDCLSGRFTS